MAPSQATICVAFSSKESGTAWTGKSPLAKTTTSHFIIFRNLYHLFPLVVTRNSDDHIKTIESSLERNTLLNIEITESAIASGEAYLNEQINRFREAGYQVSLPSS